jgi:hypothetical protein
MASYETFMMRSRIFSDGSPEAGRANIGTVFIVHICARLQGAVPRSNLKKLVDEAMERDADPTEKMEELYEVMDLNPVSF